MDGILSLYHLQSIWNRLNRFSDSIVKINFFKIWNRKSIAELQWTVDQTHAWKYAGVRRHAGMRKTEAGQGGDNKPAI